MDDILEAIQKIHSVWHGVGEEAVKGLFGC